MFSSSPTFIFKTPTIFYTTYMSKSTCMWIYLGYVYINIYPRPDSTCMGLVTMSPWTVLTVSVNKQEMTTIRCLINNTIM